MDRVAGDAVATEDRLDPILSTPPVPAAITACALLALGRPIVPQVVARHWIETRDTRRKRANGQDDLGGGRRSQRAARSGDGSEGRRLRGGRGERRQGRDLQARRQEAGPDHVRLEHAESGWGRLPDACEGTDELPIHTGD